LAQSFKCIAVSACRTFFSAHLDLDQVGGLGFKRRGLLLGLLRIWIGTTDRAVGRFKELLIEAIKRRPRASGHQLLALLYPQVQSASPATRR